MDTSLEYLDQVNSLIHGSDDVLPIDIIYNWFLFHSIHSIVIGVIVGYNDTSVLAAWLIKIFYIADFVLKSLGLVNISCHWRVRFCCINLVPCNDVDAYVHMYMCSHLTH